MRSRPDARPIVYFRAMAYEMDALACRRALVRCQVAGEFTSIEGLANAVSVSRSTASRFFGGRTSLSTALAVLDKLHLEFDDVFRPVEHQPSAIGGQFPARYGGTASGAV
jgi:hypothetical protein